MRRCDLSAVVICLITIAGLAAVEQPAGDRHRNDDIHFHPAVLRHEAPQGRVIDVTKLVEAGIATVNAIPDDGLDDTAALRAAYSWVAERLRGTHKNLPETSFIFYLPAGRYDVSETVIYDGEALTAYPGEATGRLQYIRFIGENKYRTIIRLADSCPGFQLGDVPKPVLSFHHPDQTSNNLEAWNTVQHLTIDVGVGNPAAVAIAFVGANMTGMNDLVLQSSDPDGLGAAGIMFPFTATQCYSHDITIRGFDHAVRGHAYHSMQLAFEYCSFIDQRLAAVWTHETPVSLRKVLTETRYADVPAVQSDAPGSMVVVTRCSFAGNGGPAIRLDDGHVFIQRSSQRGYDSLVQDGTQDPPAVIADLSQGFYASAQMGDAEPFDLEAPDTPSAPPLALADLEPVSGDISSPEACATALAAAMGAGRKGVILPAASYDFSGTVGVPKTVEVIDCHFASIGGGHLLITEDSDRPLYIRNMIGGRRLWITNRSQRTLVFDFAGPVSLTNDNAACDVFWTRCLGFGAMTVSGAQTRYWCRGINNEYKTGTNCLIDAATMWIFGFKSETWQTVWALRNGAQLQVLGGLINQPYDTQLADTAVIDNQDSRVSAAIYSGSWVVDYEMFTTFAAETRAGQRTAISAASLPRRCSLIYPAIERQWAMPCYASDLLPLARRWTGWTIRSGAGSGVADIEIERIADDVVLRTRDDGHADDNGYDDPGIRDDPKPFPGLVPELDQGFRFAAPTAADG